MVPESQAFPLFFPDGFALLNKNEDSPRCYRVLRDITKPTGKVLVAVIKDS